MMNSIYSQSKSYEGEKYSWFQFFREKAPRLGAPLECGRLKFTPEEQAENPERLSRLSRISCVRGKGYRSVILL
jgi:hypothetical protein